MKLILLFIALLSSVRADIGLTWEPVVGATSYVIYWKPEAEFGPEAIQVTDKDTTRLDLEFGKRYLIWVAAKIGAVEGERSLLSGLLIKVALEWTEDFTSWTNLHCVPQLINSPQRLYRARIHSTR